MHNNEFTINYLLSRTQVAPVHESGRDDYSASSQHAPYMRYGSLPINIIVIRGSDFVHMLLLQAHIVIMPLYVYQYS